MSEGNVAVATTEAAPAGTTEPVQSPPRVRVGERVEEEDAKKQLTVLAGEVARRGSRRLLWEYLRLRSKVMGK